MQRVVSPLHRSNYFLFFYLFVLMGSLGLVIYLSWEAWVKALLIAIVTIYALAIFRYHRQWQGLRWDASHFWIRHKDQDIPIKISGESTVTSLVTVLRFKMEGESKKHSCVIFKDALDPGQYRRLLVRLK